MESNVPATIQEPAVPAVTDQGLAPPPAVPAVTDEGPAPPPTARPGPRQNVTTGLFPLALGVLVLVFLALAFWTLMTATGSGL